MVGTCAGAAGAGTEEGCWRPLPALEPEPLDPDDCVAVDAEPVVLWPWNDFAAATETAPVTTTAPATIQRLTRPIRSRPASRALTAFLLTPEIFGAGCKKTLNQL